MPEMPYRYAIYFCPRAETALADFGAGWFSGRFANHIGLSEGDFAPLVATPQRYGFHGTLKPPFRLTEGMSEQELIETVEGIAQNTSPVLLSGLVLRAIGRFIAMVPSPPSDALSALATRCVMELDPFRAPPSPEELSRRRQSGLSPRQDKLLEDWGYPYVLDEFRFHLTLTGSLDQTTRDETLSTLTELTGDATGPHSIADLCICIEPSKGAPFELYQRIPLGTT